MKENHNECYAEIGTATHAMKARSALAAAAIPAELFKTESSTKRGCVYSISFSCSQANNVRAVLENSRIPVRHWNIIG